jgi:hypothetical protein
MLLTACDEENFGGFKFTVKGFDTTSWLPLQIVCELRRDVIH